jgi:hypothetical protein
MLRIFTFVWVAALASRPRRNRTRWISRNCPRPLPKQSITSKDIQPLLSKHCYSCHGPEKQKSGLRLDRKADALAGGDTGKVILPGKSAESILIPQRGRARSRPDYAAGRRTLERGRGGEAARVDRCRRDWPDDAPTASRATNHWAFKVPQPVAVPAVSGQRWLRNPIDALCFADWSRKRWRRQRRRIASRCCDVLNLDLLGLPPTPQEVGAFLNDPRPDAYERVVDRLLASPHFGERWGRRWLDLARYADSDGYEKDSPRPYAYLFRDWVIDAVNRDLPFDQFTVEQIAGDLLPNATEQQKIATGFHRQTLTNREGGVDKEEFRSKATVDRVSTTGSAWLGLTVGCAECHTHKFDPITQREFYQLYAFFNNASEKDVPAPQPSEIAEYTGKMKAWEARQAELEPAMQALINGLEPTKVQAWEDSVTIPSSRWTTLKPTKALVAVGDGETPLTPARDNTLSARLRDTARGRFCDRSDAEGKGHHRIQGRRG